MQIDSQCTLHRRNGLSLMPPTPPAAFPCLSALESSSTPCNTHQSLWLPGVALNLKQAIALHGTNKLFYDFLLVFLTIGTHVVQVEVGVWEHALLDVPRECPQYVLRKLPSDTPSDTFTGAHLRFLAVFFFAFIPTLAGCPLGVPVSWFLGRHSCVVGVRA